MRNLPSFICTALALSFALASAADDKTPPVPAPGTPTDLATPSAAAAPAPATVPATSSGSIEDLEKQLADNQEKLTTALHSYELLNEENQTLKSDAEKTASDKAALEAQVEELKKSVAFYQAQSAIVGQVDSLRTQLRQTQNEVAALASENADFRTRLALAGGPPAGGMTAPTRPGAMIENDHALTGAATNLATSAPAVSAVAAPAPAPAQPAAPKVHVVVAGDSLSKISKEYYGTANRWDEILQANRGVIHNENILPLGAKLTIP